MCSQWKRWSRISFGMAISLWISGVAAATDEEPPISDATTAATAPSHWTQSVVICADHEQAQGDRAPARQRQGASPAGSIATMGYDQPVTEGPIEAAAQVSFATSAPDTTSSKSPTIAREDVTLDELRARFKVRQPPSAITGEKPPLASSTPASVPAASRSASLRDRRPLEHLGQMDRRPITASSVRSPRGSTGMSRAEADLLRARAGQVQAAERPMHRIFLAPFWIFRRDPSSVAPVSQTSKAPQRSLRDRLRAGEKLTPEEVHAMARS